MKACFLYLNLLGLSLLFLLSSAYAKNYVPVGPAGIKKSVLAIPEIASSSTALESSLAEGFLETLKRDLEYMGFFHFLDKAAWIEDTKKTGIRLGTFQMSSWSSIGADFLIRGALTLSWDNNLEHPKTLKFEGHLYDVHLGQELLAKTYVAREGEYRLLAHSFGNDLIKALTHSAGIFLTKIAMVCDSGGHKEIYTTNIDGSELRQLTHHKGIAFSPAWHPNATQLAYSLFTLHSNNLKNIDLYEYDFLSHSIRRLSGRRGMNSGAAYSPDGKQIAVTMSFEGNASIYLLDRDTLEVKKITKSAGLDVDPSWRADGKALAFASSRSGNPMLFTMLPDGSDVSRLTYAGRYNASPSWSRQDWSLVFAGWIDKGFDIFTMKKDGTNIERLTKDQGNNEDPFFSPDGNFIAFSSNRTGQKNIYVMNTSGTSLRRLTYGLGNCTSPKWSEVLESELGQDLPFSTPSVVPSVKSSP